MAGQGPTFRLCRTVIEEKEVRVPMEFLQMNAFVSLAQTLHMPATAQELNTTQSHISKLIASLEAELGSKLFDRVGRGIALNEHGKLFYEYAAGALRLINDGQTALKGVKNSVLGTVKIGAYAFTPILHPCIRIFAQKNPQVNFYFSEVQQQNTNVLMDLTDLVLVAEKEGSYTMQSHFPVCRELLEEEFYVAISPKLCHYPKSKTSVTLTEVSQFPMIEVAPSPYYQNWVFREKDMERFRDILGVTFRIGYTTNDFFTKVSMLDQGLGFALFPEVCVASALRISPDLQILPIEDYPIRRRILIARKPRERMSSSARKFWDFLLDYYDLEPDR